MNLTQVLILLLQLIEIGKISELSGEAQVSQNLQPQLYSVNIVRREESL